MTKGKSINRETLLLLLLAGFGLAGLAFLQFGQKGPSESETRALVQAQEQQVSTDAQTAAKFQKITGRLLKTDKPPEAGQAFEFQLIESMVGPDYELDMGDGQGRRPFVNGVVKCMIPRQKEITVTLYARYEGQEALLDRQHIVLHHVKKKNPLGDAVDY
jgi:hypothetical protein